MCKDGLALSSSHTDGQRQLIANPKTARTIRRILAEELQYLAQNEVARRKGFLVVKPVGRLHFVVGKRKLTISASQIVTFGTELVDKRLLHKLGVGNGEAFYYPTESGWTAFRTGNPLVHQSPPVAYTPDLKSKQKTVHQKIVAAEKMQIGNTPMMGSFDKNTALPLARDCLIPMLSAALHQPQRVRQLIGATARHMNYPEDQIHRRKPVSTNQTFAVRAQRAMDYLVSHGYLKKKTKALSATAKARRLLQEDLQDVTWPDFQEPKVRLHSDLMRKPALGTSFTPKGANFSGNVVVPSILENIEGLAPHTLVTMWQNANRLLSKPDQAGSHEKARTVVAQVTAEWERRSSSGRPEDYFRWPSTEARGGNGTLTLDKSEKEGMLAYLQYHVGRTHGQPSRVRQSTLTRVFEQSLPPVFDRAYLSLWGQNGSAPRLQKMAESIAAFTRNAKHRNPDALDEAIRQWEEDLKFLHDRYYVGKFHFDFAWPMTSIS